MSRDLLPNNLCVLCPIHENAVFLFEFCARVVILSCCVFTRKRGWWWEAVKKWTSRDSRLAETSGSEHGQVGWWAISNVQWHPLGGEKNHELCRTIWTSVKVRILCMTNALGRGGSRNWEIWMGNFFGSYLGITVLQVIQQGAVKCLFPVIW